MKFYVSSIAIYFIILSVVQILSTTAKISKTELEKLAREKVPRHLEHQMFDMYAKDKIKGMPLQDNLQSGPVYFQGWAKYFRYDNGEETKKPTDFFINNEYFHQRVLRRMKDSKDKWGKLFIPSKFHFYIAVTQDTISFLSSRDNAIQKSVDSLQVDLINPIPVDNRFMGGVKVLGEFDEGNCFQILTTIPEGNQPTFDNAEDFGINQNWVLCLDNIAERSLVMKTLIKIKLLKQQVRGQDLQSADKRKPSLSKLLHPVFTPKFEHYHGPGADLDKDGFWVLLQNWSQCTLKCGGGNQYQQWLCQPPLPGGKPCMGQSIRIRPCNMHPCPNIGGDDPFKKKKTEKVAKPIIKSMPWSSRLQRYIECEVKETDVLYIKKDIPGRFGKEVKMPGRMVMTNRTIALYEDDTFHHNLFTFDIKKLSIANDLKDYCCLIIESLDKHFKVCGFQDSCGTRNEPHFTKNWVQAFNLFAHKCYNDLPRKNWKDSLKEEEDEDHMHITIPVEGLQARENIIKRKMMEQQRLEIDNKITSTQELALRAIRKEIKLERLIKHEEKMKEKKKINDLVRLKQKEEKKKDCLEKALKDREAQNKMGRSSQEAELEIAKIKHEAKKDVEKERLNLRKKIDQIKKKGERRRRLLEQQITYIRSSMAKQLLDANKNGSMDACLKANKDPSKVREYCDANYVDNFQKNSECKEVDHFCPTCCENEFGGLYLNNRDDCYKKCDEQVKEDLKGDWVWSSVRSSAK